MKGMKKTFITLAAVLFTAVSAHALEAKVTAVSGKVEVQKGGSWVAVKVGDVLQKGAVISTGFKSSAELTINGSKLSLGPLTRMTVEQLASNESKDETKVYIDSGRVSASVKATESKKVDFKVSSPVATASVRGTSFTMGADGTLVTTEGLVSKGPAEKKLVADREQGASDFVPAEGESTPTTSTTEVSDTYGIPVYAGQTSTTDASTGKAASPQAVQASSSVNLSGTTSTLSSREGQSSAAASGTPQSAEPAPLPAKKTGSLRIKITFSGQ